MKTTMNIGEYASMYHVEEELWWYRGLRDVLGRYISPQKERALQILDAGCGTGMNMHYLHSLGHTVYGIDNSPEAVIFSKKRGLKNIKQGSVTKLPYKDNHFDVVLSMDVIGLLDAASTVIALQEMYRVLKPKGLLMLHTAAFEFLRSSHDEVSHVQKRYIQRELASLFKHKYWIVEKVSYRMFLLFIPLALIKIVKKLKKSKQKKGDLFLPHPVLNIVLYGIQLLENFFLRFISYPIGTSLFIVARKR